MLRRARLAGLLVVALLACASPALAASPVSDQYLSSPAPVKRATPSSGAAAQSAAPAGAPSASASAAPTTAAAQSAARARQSAAKPIKVGRASANTNAEQPLGSSSSKLPLIALGGAGLLLLAFAFLAIGRARRPLATP
jgi:cobalamin biosynthesis Mg chelatase CobN